jgi:hypothetical protein
MSYKRNTNQFMVPESLHSTPKQKKTGATKPKLAF